MTLSEEASAIYTATRVTVNSLTPRPYPPTVEDVRWLQNGSADWCDILLLRPGRSPRTARCALWESLRPEIREVIPQVAEVVVVAGIENNPTMPVGTRYIGVRGTELVPWPTTITP